MIRMELAEIARCSGAPPAARNPLVSGITTDSRRVEPGMLFAALPGAHTDGHQYALAAEDAGAAAILASRQLECHAPLLLVDDVLAALGRIAAAWRRRVDPVVVAITGSNGKTTTKELLGNILGADSGVLTTAGNFNNELGLPLTLFELDESHRTAVLEFGASKAGDISYLAEIAGPDVGLVTNVGPAHLEGFGDEEGVARAKGELFACLPADGCAVINADEPWRDLWSDMSTATRKLYFSRAGKCDVYPVSAGGGIRVFCPAGDFELQLNLPGEHNVQNALAATAVACALDIPLDRIRAGLAATRPVPGRLNLVRAAGGWTVIDDTYNANPASLYAALQVLTHELGESWLVLGDMKELGPDSRKMHAEMGDAAHSLGVSRLFAIGECAIATADAFGEGARHFAEHADLISALSAELHPGVTCLVKGSRSMGMERVVRAITGPAGLREAR
jgi:UDP-N-acetylmuramoyl-tripeptide--D-alanyl-D-alanine ligase